MISVTPLTGIKNVTTFTFTVAPSSENPSINWGDGEFSFQNISTHIYSRAGIYNIYGGSCSATSAFSLSVSEGDFFTDKIEVYSNAPSAWVGTEHIFNIHLSSSNEYSTVLLYSSGSDSIPFSDDRTFWSHLKPEWSFNYNGKNISAIIIQGSPVYSGTHVLGYSAISSVSYSDDMPKNVNLCFTLQYMDVDTPINSRVYSIIQHSVSASIPDKLFITADGINPLNKLQWADMDIPYLISVGSSQNSSTNILHYVSGNITGIRFNANCFGLGQDSFVTPICAIELGDECNRTGGYLLNNFFVPSSALNSQEITNNLTTCNPDYERLEYIKNRKTPKNVSISATGIFSYNGKEYILSGVSDTFDVIAFENRHEFFRKGEDTTLYDILKSSLPFDLDQYTNFNTYLSAMIGQGDSLGKIYDKVHNYSSDHSDIDTCTVDSLINKSIMLDEPISEFGLDLPEELRRVFDFSSIPLNKLVGSRCGCNTNFESCVGCANSNICTICKFDKRSNLGRKLTLTDIVTAKTTILYKENGNKTFNFLTISPQESDTFALGTLSSEPFYSRGLNNFCFYEWNNTPQSNPVDGIVNFKDPRNMLNYTLSSESEWYGDNGIVEEIFNYILTKNLVNNSI